MSSLTSKKILIRADSSVDIGTGHIMRTHVLAQVFKERGASVTYACRDCEGHLIPFLEQQGYFIRKLSSAADIKFKASDYSTWLGQSVQDDIGQCFSEKGTIYDLVVLDHYGAGTEWQRLAKQYTKHLMALDDEAQARFDCDILLNQNYSSTPNTLYQNKTTDNCLKLIGPDYASLRPEFSLQRPDAEPRSQLKNLLVMMGGADSAQVTKKIIEHIDIDLLQSITVVIGRAYQGEEDLRSVCTSKNISLICGANNVAELMKSADLCIGAGGSTSWERCCMQLPCLVFSAAGNQIPIAQELEAAGAVQHLGTSQDFDFNQLNAIILAIKNNPEKLRVMSEKAGKLVDGRGSERVLGAIDALLTAEQK